MKTYHANHSYKALENSIIEEINIHDFVNDNFFIKDAWIHTGGYQSWSPGYEIQKGRKQDSLKCHLIKGWNNYLVFPQTKFKPSKNTVLGQFVTYLRWDDFYLVFASVGNVKNDLPPLQFIFNRKENTVTFEIADKNYNWKENEVQAEIEIFTAVSYFECKDKLKSLFCLNHFEKIKNLGSSPAGWESWYNHYANINEDLILNDLESLCKTENLISKGNFTAKIFQIDDGWEENLGDWDARTDRFPHGLKVLAEKIEEKDFIPGLWLAPFIIDSRSKTAIKNPSWILKNEKEQPVIAGFNPLWGKRGNFYCLDLSNNEVLEHLDNLMDKVINDWGFRYIKLDFLYAGMLYGKYCVDSAGFSFYSKAIKILTSRNVTNSGKPVFYLGCGLPFELSFKYFPLSRIGCDTYEKWENKISKLLNWNGRNSAYLNIKDTLGHAMWDKTIFANDPDVLFIRNDNCSLTTEEKKLIANVDILFGSQLMYSDDPFSVNSPDEKKLTKDILKFRNDFINEEFGLKQIKKDFYEIFSRSEKYKGTINLKDKHEVKINLNQYV